MKDLKSKDRLLKIYPKALKRKGRNVKYGFSTNNT